MDKENGYRESKKHMALKKWYSWIGLQPVLVLTDHKALEQWAHEALDTPSGPIGRRLRWHLILSRFDITVGYIPGREISSRMC